MSYRVPPPFSKSEVTSSTVVTWNAAVNASLAVTLDAATVRLNNPSNLLANTRYPLYIIQGVSGGYEVVFGTEVVDLTGVSCTFAWQSGTTSRCTTSGDISSLVVGSTVAFENATSNIWNCGNMPVTDVQGGYFEFTHPYVTDASNDLTSNANISAVYSIYSFADGMPVLDTRPNAVNAFDCYSGVVGEFVIAYLGSTSDSITSEAGAIYNIPFSDDFIEPVHSSAFYNNASSGGSYNYPTGYAPRVGIARLGVNAGSASSYYEVSRVNAAYLLSDSSFIGETNVKLEYLPDTTNEEYTVFFGLTNNKYNTASATNLVCFKAEDTWQLITEASSTQTVVDSGIPTNVGLTTTTGWSKLGLRVTETAAYFYINNVLVGIITTNIPVSTAMFAYLEISRHTSVGTATRYMYIDNLNITWQSKVEV